MSFVEYNTNFTAWKGGIIQCYCKNFYLLKKNKPIQLSAPPLPPPPAPPTILYKNSLKREREEYLSHLDTNKRRRKM